MSGHADRDGLLKWVRSIPGKPDRTFVIHGEEESATAFATTLKEECGFENIDIPKMNQSFSL